MNKCPFFCQRYLVYAILFIITIATNSCNSHKIENKIMKMQSEVIKIKTNRMICLADSGKSIRKESLKWIVYHDSVACKPCQIAHISDWDKILRLKGVDCYFIFSAKSCEVEKYIEAYRNNKIEANVYLDTANIFVRDNPQIPYETIYHKFLVDENNSVLLVGNPINNKSISELFLKILDTRIQGLEARMNKDEL